MLDRDPMTDRGGPTEPARSARGATPSGSAAQRELALKVIAHYAGTDAGSEAVAAAAGRIFEDLDRVVSPLIGHLGVDSLTGRALHLAALEYPCVVTKRGPDQADRPFAQVLVCLEQQEAADATAAAAAVFATFTGLLGTFIGEPLTARLLRKAWPDAFSGTTN
jgi:hypothetical protein